MEFNSAFKGLKPRASYLPAKARSGFRNLPPHDLLFYSRL